jgi:SPP1 gp7 family putative phage head morphogenesis protein
MLATSNDKANRICMALSVPQSLLDASGRTFNNAGNEERNFWLDTMFPDLHEMEDDINLHIAPRLGPHIAMFDTSHVASLQPPAKFLAIKLDEAVDRKIITPAEARSEMGFPLDFAAEDPITGATMTEQAQMITALQIAGWDAATIAKIMHLEAPPVVEEPDVPAPSPFGTTPALVPAVPSQNWSAGLSVVRSLRDADERKQQRRATWRQADALTRGQEGVWEAALKRLFARQKAQALKRLESRAARWAKSLETRADPPDINPDDVFDPAFWTTETTTAVQGLFQTLYAASGARVAGSLGSQFSLNDPAVMAQIDYRASQLAEQVTSTTYDAIRSVIMSGIAAGKGIPDISAGIEAVFEQADRARATLIARTETIQASTDGALAAYTQASDQGMLDGYGKVWIAENDERECPDCEALDGEQVAFEDQFSDGEDGPPDHPDCRCAVGAEPMDTTGRSITPEHARDVLQAIAAGDIRATDLVA